MTIRNVIFDCGGVLLEWNPRRMLAERYPHAPTAARIHDAIYGHADWQALDRGTLTDSDAITRFHQRTGRPVAEMQTLMRATWESLTPVPGSLELLADLRGQGIGLYCLSNMAASTWRYLSGRHAFWSAFDGVVISAHLRMLKPEPAIFEHTLAAHGLDPAETIFIDDLATNVDAARAVGLRGIRFESAPQTRAALAALGVTGQTAR
jgi:HAD superfamily hydrolase (TIGR01509 family)